MPVYAGAEPRVLGGVLAGGETDIEGREQESHGYLDGDSGE